MAKILCDPPALDWTQTGPRASDFDDVYFSAEDGLEETRAVFLQGCGLPDAWTQRRVFTVGELGFGTGLNALALWELWRRAGDPDGWLHLVTVEKHPLTADQARRAFSAWPALKDLSDRLLDAWPPRWRGAHRLVFAEDRFSITIHQDDAETALSQWQAPVDAWFLDGFAPSRNESMWSDAVLRQVGRLSAPGARAATFTVAGAVRRGLEAVGFEVSKQPGFGRKRQRLEARMLDGEAQSRHAASRPEAVAIIGAGIAGASLARACRMRGVEAIVFDPAGPAGGASGAPAGLLTPRLERSDAPHQLACLSAFAYARRLYGGLDGFHPDGALRLAKDDKEARRFAELAALMGEGFDWDADARGLSMAMAGRFEPARLVVALLGETTVERRRLEPGETAGADIVIAAAGAGGRAWLDAIGPNAGRVAIFDAPPPARPLVWGGYACAARDGLLLGASHVRGEEPGEAGEEIAGFRAAALEHVPALRGTLPEAHRSDWTGVRAVTPDRLPVAGRLAEGVALLGGMGSRGFAHAPLLAEMLVSDICGEPGPLGTSEAQAFRPERFAERAARKAGR